MGCPGDRFGSVPGKKAVWGNRLNPGFPNSGQWAMGPCPESLDGEEQRVKSSGDVGPISLHVNEKSNVLLWESLQIMKSLFTAQGSEHRVLSLCVASPYSHKSRGWCLNHFLKTEFYNFISLCMLRFYMGLSSVRVHVGAGCFLTVFSGG